MLAQDIASAAITLPAGIGTTTAIQLNLVLAGDVSDTVGTLDHGATSAAILVGTDQTPTDGAALTYTEADATSIIELTGGAPLTGTVTPAEPFAPLHGAYSSSGWALSLITVGETPVDVVSCTLMLAVSMPAVPASNPVAASPDGDWSPGCDSE